MALQDFTAFCMARNFRHKDLNDARDKISL